MSDAAWNDALRWHRIRATDMDAFKMSKSGKKHAIIANELRGELRSILRTRRDLYSPIQRFEAIVSESGEPNRYYVLFDMHPRIEFQGIKLGGSGTLCLPDEHIQDQVLELAKATWHLKDRLHQFAKAAKKQVDVDAYSKKSESLLICADLANRKKHGRHENRSKQNPYLGLVKFDTSRSGGLEFFYDGAMKTKGLIVENPVPIPFSVDVLAQQGEDQQKDDTILGDAREIINSGFCDWLPLIDSIGLLSGDDPETITLRSILFDPPPAE